MAGVSGKVKSGEGDELQDSCIGNDKASASRG